MPEASASRESDRRIHAARRLAAALGLGVALGGCASGDGPVATVTDSAGVRLVTATASDRPVAPVVETRRLEVPDGALTAVPWGVAADPAARRIYALDWTGERVAVFDRDGVFVEWIGRRGEGPGEFRNPSALAVDPGGTLHVLDGGRGVVSRWSVTGELLDERRAPGSYWGPGLAATRDAWLYVVSSESDMQQRETLVRDRGEETEELHSVVRELVMMELPCVRQPAAPVLAPSVVWAARDDTLYVRDGPGYRIDVLADGRLVASYRRPLEAIPVTGRMAEARVEMGPYSGVMRACGVSAAEIVAEIGHEEVVSPLLWLAVDPGGRIWVTRTDDGVRPARVDVLGARGAYLGTLDLAAIPVAFLSDSAFVAVSLAELGQVALALYELGPGGGPGAAGRPGSSALPGATAAGAAGEAAEAGTRSGQTNRGSGKGGTTPVADRPLAPGEFRDCDVCPVMVELPPGPLVLGRVPDEAPAAADPTRPEWTERSEEPRVEGEIARPFAIGKYEVTFADWNACVSHGGCSTRPDDEGWGRGDRPVVHVSRSDALEYVAWLGERTGEPYRLPSEAEWEYAARAGTETARWWGDSLGEGRTVCDGCGSRWDDRSTAPVGSFPPNPFGLHDMLGNVSEWVADCWHETHEGQPADGSPRIETSPWWKDGECERPGEKGGAWSFYAWTTRAAHRSYWRPRPVPPPWPDHSRSGGFRVARSLDPGEAPAPSKGQTPGTGLEPGPRSDHP